MEDFEIVLVALFVSVAGLNAIARWLSVPYPILLVLGGLVLGLLPGHPGDRARSRPGARDLPAAVAVRGGLLRGPARPAQRPARRSPCRRSGWCWSTIGAVAVVAHEVIGLSWPLAFALGAIVSPTDPVAATAIMRRLGAPRRLVNVIEGESLVNDATALVAYRVAVAAAVGGSFSARRRGARVPGGRRRRDRDRAGRRLRGRRDPAPARRRADGDHDLAAHRLRGVHPRGRARPLRRAGRGHRRASTWAGGRRS